MHDDIDPYIATQNVAIVLHPLAEIISCSLSNGILPQMLKIAKVVPIF